MSASNILESKNGSSFSTLKIHQQVLNISENDKNKISNGLIKEKEDIPLLEEIRDRIIAIKKNNANALNLRQILTHAAKENIQNIRKRTPIINPNFEKILNKFVITDHFETVNISTYEHILARKYLELLNLDLLENYHFSVPFHNYTMRSSSIQVTLDEMLAEIKHVVENNVDREDLSYLTLFGSYARGEGTILHINNTDHFGSDLDILLILNHSDKEKRSAVFKQMQQVLRPIASKYAICIDIEKPRFLYEIQQKDKFLPHIYLDHKTPLLHYSLRFGKVIIGNPTDLKNDLKFATPHLLSYSNFRDVILLRMIRLLEAKYLLDQPFLLNAENIIQIIKNMHQLIISIGDALLFLEGFYHGLNAVKMRYVPFSTKMDSNFKKLYLEACQSTQVFEPGAFEQMDFFHFNQWVNSRLDCCEHHYLTFQSYIFGILTPISWDKFCDSVLLWEFSPFLAKYSDTDNLKQMKFLELSQRLHESKKIISNTDLLSNLFHDEVMEVINLLVPGMIFNNINPQLKSFIKLFLDVSSNDFSEWYCSYHKTFKDLSLL